MKALGEKRTVDEWLSLLMEFGKINLKCMELLDKANTKTYGHPIPTEVSMVIEKGPFIVVSGHDLHDLENFLSKLKTRNKHLYPQRNAACSPYPELKVSSSQRQFRHRLHNQQKEFDGVPGVPVHH